MPGTHPPADAEVVARLREAGCVRAEDEAALLADAAASAGDLDVLLARRVAGEPLEHVLGWASFAGIRVGVAPGVFVPRHRSEHLVAVAAAWLTGHRAHAGVGATVVDLCAGTGALGLALHHRAGPFRLLAVDIDPVAATCAAANLAPVGGTALAGDLYAPLPADLRGRIDLILANAPYVPTARMALLPREAREHERPAALDGGHDGLTVHRAVLAGASTWLRARGAVAVELSERQVPALLGIARAAGLTAATRPDPEDPGTAVLVAVR